MTHECLQGREKEVLVLLRTGTVSFLFVPKHPVLEPWNPRLRMKVEIRILGSRLLIAQSPHLSLQLLTTSRQVASAPQHSETFPKLQSFSILELDRTHLKYLSFAGCQISSSSFPRFVKKSEKHDIGGWFLIYRSQIVCFIKLLFDVTLVYSWSPTANLTSEAFLMF